ncbi:MAG: hypothetical protein AB7P04_13465, partial [Bacteriovoracia bacterium]
MNDKILTKWVGALSLLAAFASGCSQQEFVKGAFVNEQQGPGNFEIPARVDILLVEDDTGSMSEVFGQISAQMPQFLNQLEQQGWDWRFAVIPLTTNRPISQIGASKYSGNWGSSWKPPYIGASPTDPGNFVPNYFTQSFSAFLSSSEINPYGGEPGLKTIDQIMTSTNTVQNFLRPDALAAVVVVGNGNDTSDVKYCQTPNQPGQSEPCNGVLNTERLCGTGAGCPAGPYYCQHEFGHAAPCPGTLTHTLNAYKQRYDELNSPSNSNSAAVKLYAAVSNITGNGCINSNSYSIRGERYQQIASHTGGASFDVCSQSIPSVLSSLSNELHNQRIAYRTSFLVIAEEPVVSSVIVTKYPGGDQNNPQVIPQDPNNGWTYVGYRTEYLIDYP